MGKGIVNLKTIVAAIVLLILGACGHSTISYSATCVRCLQHGYGYERSIFGIPYWKQFTLSQNLGGIMSPAIFSPGVAQIDPSLYEVIVGQRCKHDFQRGGFCRSGMGIIACGAYGASRQYVPRTDLVEQTYRAYLRVPDKALARETYELLDSILPIDKADPPYRRVQIYQYSPEQTEARAYRILNDGLALVTTSEEWHQLLQAIQNSANTNLTLIGDRSVLIQRLKDPRTEVRIKALDQLAGRNEPESWEAVAEALTDASLRDRAVRHIVTAKQWPHLAAALKAKPPVDVSGAYGDRRLDGRHEVGKTYDEPFRQLAKSLTTEEIRTLFNFEDTDVDRFCLAAIRLQHHFDLLDDVLVLLNRTHSQDAADAIEDLLLGPDPFNEKLYVIGKPTRHDPWVYIRDELSEDPPPSGFTRGARHAHGLDQTVKQLSRQHRSEDWPRLKEIYAERIQGGGGSWIAAGIAQAMYETDRERTRSYLIETIKSLPSGDRVAHEAVGAAGEIADPAVLPVLEELQKRINGDTFRFGAYRLPLIYALHRCRGIQHWKLIRRADGSYEIQKPTPDSKQVARQVQNTTPD